MRIAALGMFLVVVTAGLVDAQQEPTTATSPGPLAMPLDVRGLVHRAAHFGCGQAWQLHEAWSRTTLSVSARGVARLEVEARTVDEAGGVERLLTGGPYHSLAEHVRRVAWTGRARREGAALTIMLSSLIETTDVAGAPPGTLVTNRSTSSATLRCALEAREVFGSAAAPLGETEQPTSRRALVSCSFDVVRGEGPLPRAVAETLTTPFFLDRGAGVTTDARYVGGLSVPAPSLVAREPIVQP